MDLDLRRIEEAAHTIDPVFLNTPQYADEQLSAALGRNVVVKIETANPLRSFKGRGAGAPLARRSRWWVIDREGSRLRSRTTVPLGPT